MTRTYTCSDCGRLGESGRRGRLRVRCPDCAVRHNQRTSLAWARAHSKQAYESRRGWVKKNRDKMCEYSRRWRARNPEKVRAYNRKYMMRRAALKRLLRALEESPEQ